MNKKVNKKVIKETYGDGISYYRIEYVITHFTKLFSKEVKVYSETLKENNFKFTTKDAANAYAKLTEAPSRKVKKSERKPIPDNYLGFELCTVLKYYDVITKDFVRTYALLSKNSIENLHICITNNIRELCQIHMLTNYGSSYSYANIQDFGDEHTKYINCEVCDAEKILSGFIKCVKAENGDMLKEKYEADEAKRLKTLLISTEVVSDFNSNSVKAEKAKEKNLEKALKNETTILDKQREKMILDEIKRVDEYKESLRKFL